MKPSDDIVRTANEFANRKPDETDGFIALNLARAILAHIDTHAGSGEVERIADSNESFLIGYAAGKRHAGGVPSAVEVTVEEWEALEDCVSTDRGQYDANTRLLAGKALRKLNARAALSKSETTQPATDDGTGEDDLLRMFRGYEFHASVCGDRKVLKLTAEQGVEVSREALQKARELGAKEAQPHRIAVRVLRERDELKEKLAAAEAAGKVLVEANARHFKTATENHERAEKAEARVAAWRTVVLWACIEQTTPAERALQIEHFASQIPTELRPEVKP